MSEESGVTEDGQEPSMEEILASIRRILSEEGDILNFKAVDWMTQSPVSTQLGVSLGDAVRVMEDRSSQISVLPVVAESGDKLLGLLRLHDVYQPNFS